MTPHPIDVLLVASVPDGDTSLGLGYVASALAAAGHRPEQLVFQSLAEVPALAERVLARRAPLLGLALPSAEAALEVLTLARVVRLRGYPGHITVGGPFATLARDRLLAEERSIDSVIRHAGELPIVALANAVAQGDSPDDLPAVSTRTSPGRAARLTDPTRLGLRPLRARYPLYAGVHSAKISAVRGCWGRCRYCGLSALSQDARREARHAGLSRCEIERAGIGGMQRRPVPELADEMAALYHQEQVRYFHFVDENHLPPDPEQACAVIRELHRALQRRSVGARAVSLMLRADIARHARVVRELARLGVVRCLLGVESNTQVGLRALGRDAPLDANRQAMDNLVASGMSFHFNLLLIRPESTLDAIDQEIAALGRVHGGIVDPFQVEVLEGTDFFAELRRQGRLRGGPYLWYFEPVEPAARRYASGFRALRSDAFGRLALTAYAYETLGTLAVAKQLDRLDDTLPELETVAARLLVEHNRLWHETLQELSVWARSDPRVRLGELLRRARERSAALTLELRDLRERMECAARLPLRSEVVYPRARHAATLALAIVAAACSSGSRAPEQPVRDAATEESMSDSGSIDTSGSDAQAPDAGRDADPDGPSGDAATADGGPLDAAHDTGPDSASDASTADSGPPDATHDTGPDSASDASTADSGPPDAAHDTGPDSTSDASTADSGPLDAAGDGATRCADLPREAGACTESLARDELQQVFREARSAGSCDCREQSTTYRLVLDSQGKAVDLEVSEGATIPAELVQCFLDVVRDQVFPCSCEYPNVWEPCLIALK